MSFLQKANLAIGQKYDRNTNHCYSLVMELLPNAPKIEYMVGSASGSALTIEKSIKLYNLKSVDKFENEDIILMGTDGVYSHVGVYYNGGVVHSDVKRGVVYDRLEQLQKIFLNIRGVRLR